MSYYAVIYCLIPTCFFFLLFKPQVSLLNANNEKFKCITSIFTPTAFLQNSSITFVFIFNSFFNFPVKELQGHRILIRTFETQLMVIISLYLFSVASIYNFLLTLFLFLFPVSLDNYNLSHIYFYSTIQHRLIFFNLIINKRHSIVIISNIFICFPNIYIIFILRIFSKTVIRFLINYKNILSVSYLTDILYGELKNMLFLFYCFCLLNIIL